MTNVFSQGPGHMKRDRFHGICGTPCLTWNMLAASPTKKCLTFTPMLLVL
jgi:hypothetical protein